MDGYVLDIELRIGVAGGIAARGRTFDVASPTNWYRRSGSGMCYCRMSVVCGTQAS